MNNINETAALLVAAAGAICALAALVAYGSRIALPVLLEFLTAAALIRLAADPSWGTILLSAGLVAGRVIASNGLHLTGRRPARNGGGSSVRQLADGHAEDAGLAVTARAPGTAVVAAYECPRSAARTAGLPTLGEGALDSLRLRAVSVVDGQRRPQAWAAQRPRPSAEVTADRTVNASSGRCTCSYRQ
ncbi:hypothetical protein OG239_02685 [Streptomyces sp. NBC_00868]|uniref:hypothetical protein n=1 Tax=unclassified Streptomyces TaxID=2593676 RepID=UPI00324F4B25|nr:hypothetical protein OG239_02685 [Streptomyces sp. NBC_00868]